jgi:membrane protein YdbS with pleckstrin-like domain
MSDGRDEHASDRRPAGPEASTESMGARRSASTADRQERAQARDSAEFDERVARSVTAVRAGRERRSESGLLLEYTTGRRDLHPSVRFQWGLRAAIGVAVATAVLTGLLSATPAPVELGVVVLLGLALLGTGWVLLQYRRWVYQVREDSLYLERGVVIHRRTHVPYVRIQHVDTSRGPVERWLGLSTLVVYTAGSRGADVSIPGLEPAEASDLQQRVKQLAIEAEGDDAL